MGRTKFVEHSGRSIVLMDFSNIWSVNEAVKVIEEARLFVAAQPRVQTLLTLVDVKEAAFDDRVIEKLKQLAEHDKPWVLASAIVGLSGMQRIMYGIVATFARRKMGAFKTREEAMEWLVKQKEPPTVVPEA